MARFPDTHNLNASLRRALGDKRIRIMLPAAIIALSAAVFMVLFWSDGKSGKGGRGKRSHGSSGNSSATYEGRGGSPIGGKRDGSGGSRNGHAGSKDGWWYDEGGGKSGRRSEESGWWYKDDRKPEREGAAENRGGGSGSRRSPIADPGAKPYPEAESETIAERETERGEKAPRSRTGNTRPERAPKAETGSGPDNDWWRD